MARSRNIKPSFFTNDELAEIPPLGRLLFVGLWTIADREGRLEDRPKRMKMEILPYDECDVGRLLNELDARGFIKRYQVNSVGYIQIRAFSKHQNPHVKEPVSVIPPEPCEHGASTVPELPLMFPSSISPSSATDDVPDGVLPHVWRDWQKHRGKKLSKEAIRRQTERLAELKALGQDPNAVILQSIERGWSGLFELKTSKAGNGTLPEWWASEAATKEQGAKLGLKPRGNESWNDFRGRIREALRSSH